MTWEIDEEEIIKLWHGCEPNVIVILPKFQINYHALLFSFFSFSGLNFFPVNLLFVFSHEADVGHQLCNQDFSKHRKLNEEKCHSSCGISCGRGMNRKQGEGGVKINGKRTKRSWHFKNTQVKSKRSQISAAEGGMWVHLRWRTCQSEHNQTARV